jgi:hypothetical protein
VVAWISDPSGDENCEILFGLTVALHIGAEHSEFWRLMEHEVFERGGMEWLIT